MIFAVDRWASCRQIRGWSRGYGEPASDEQDRQITEYHAAWQSALRAAVDPSEIDTYAQAIMTFGAEMEECGRVAAIAFCCPDDMAAGEVVTARDAAAQRFRWKWVVPLLGADL